MACHDALVEVLWSEFLGLCGHGNHFGRIVAIEPIGRCHLGIWRRKHNEGHVGGRLRIGRWSHVIVESVEGEHEVLFLLLGGIAGTRLRSVPRMRFGQFLVVVGCH